VSSIQLCEPGASERILAILNASGFDPRRFQIEVTETAMLSDFQTARENIRGLREAGALIALDDFGAGHASISYLREMSFDVVKLDGSLVKDLTNSIHATHLLKGIIDLCRSLGVQYIAEHVETIEQFVTLQELGCDLVQGHFIGRPSTLSHVSYAMNGDAHICPVASNENLGIPSPVAVANFSSSDLKMRL